MLIRKVHSRCKTVLVLLILCFAPVYSQDNNIQNMFILSSDDIVIESKNEIVIANDSPTTIAVTISTTPAFQNNNFTIEQLLYNDAPVDSNTNSPITDVSITQSLVKFVIHVHRLELKPNECSNVTLALAEGTDNLLYVKFCIRKYTTTITGKSSEMRSIPEDAESHISSPTLDFLSSSSPLVFSIPASSSPLVFSTPAWSNEDNKNDNSYLMHIVIVLSLVIIVAFVGGVVCLILYCVYQNKNKKNKDKYNVNGSTNGSEHDKDMTVFADSALRFRNRIAHPNKRQPF